MAQYDKPVAFTKYYLAGQTGAVSRDPVNWTVEGSSDGTSWTTLDTRTAQSLPNTYTFANVTAYLYYRINVSANNGNGYLGIGNFTLQDPVAVSPPGPSAQMNIVWDGVRYAKGDSLPTMSVSQARHMRARGYANTAATLVVGKPFKHGGTTYASGAAMPAGLTDPQLRRLIAGRFLI